MQLPLHSLGLLVDERCEAISLLQERLLLPSVPLRSPFRVLIIFEHGCKLDKYTSVIGHQEMEERLLSKKGGGSPE